MIHGQSSLDLLQTFFSQTNTSVTIVSVIFSTLGNVLTNAEALKELNTFHFNGSRWFLNSRLASITVRPRPPDVIKPPFKLALETNKVTYSRLASRHVSKLYIYTQQIIKDFSRHMVINFQGVGFSG